MDLKFSESDVAFRQEVVNFLKSEYPEDIKEKQDKRMPLEKEEIVRWQKILNEKGWFAINWPTEYTGQEELTVTQKYILQEGYLDLTNVGKQAHNMAMQVIQQGLCNVTEFYGSECTLYYPGLYAGQTDLIASHKNEMAILDFKQTNKPKKREWVEDYCLQLAAYGMAHDFVYKTAITKAVIMMCSKDNFYQEFVIEGAEYRKYKHKWLGRVDEYYKNRSEKIG